MVGDVASDGPSLALLLGRRAAALGLVVLARCVAGMCLRVVVVQCERLSQPLADVRPQLLQLVDELIAPSIAIHASPPAGHGTIASPGGPLLRENPADS
jgi:hypothetical protein